MWILVANRARAKLFERQYPGAPIVALETLEHPEGRKKNQQFDTDRPGLQFDRRGSGQHPMAPEHDAADQEAERFTRILCERLEKAAHAGTYSSLALVAEPRMLGRLRKHLSPWAAARIVQSLNLNLLSEDDHALLKQLSIMLAPAPDRPAGSKSS